MSKRNTLIFPILIAILLVFVGFLSWYQDERASSGNSNQSDELGVTEYASQDFGVRFTYPSSYIMYSETKNLPEGNQANIYADSDDRTYTISINLYQGQGGVKIDDFIIQQQRNNNILLPELVLGEGFTPFTRSEKVLNGKSYVVFTNRQTGDRSYFLSKEDRMAMIQEQGSIEGQEEVFDQVAASFELTN
ncbi:MAG: hypothetical protein V1685_04195 [Parcubacteria group bacterium]